MKVAYFDCFAGASGDMILGALMDAGLKLDLLKEGLAKLHLSHYDLQAEKVVKKGIGGTQALVIIEEHHHHDDDDHHHHHHHHRNLHDIREIVENSDLDIPIKEKCMAIFVRIAEAEAKVHQTTVDKIHFHEVGAMDSIIDVVGAVIGLHALNIEKIFCSPLHVGSGTVECAHGTLPVPAPATAELLQGVPIFSTGVKGELLTPTGAAILTTLSTQFGPMPPMTIKQVGYGSGTSDIAIPNLLRVSIGEMADDASGYEVEQIAVIETNIDDMNPEVYDYLIQKALDLGALDIYLTPAQMKKNRPATLLTVTCSPDRVNDFSDFLLRETTTIGVRWRIDTRIKAHRSIHPVQTKYGTVNFKISRSGSETITTSPEYEECKRIAREKDIPLKLVLNAAVSAAADIDFIK